MRWLRPKYSAVDDLKIKLQFAKAIENINNLTT